MKALTALRHQSAAPAIKSSTCSAAQQQRAAKRCARRAKLSRRHDVRAGTQQRQQQRGAVGASGPCGWHLQASRGGGRSRVLWILGSSGGQWCRGSGDLGMYPGPCSSSSSRNRNSSSSNRNSSRNTSQNSSSRRMACTGKREMPATTSGVRRLVGHALRAALPLMRPVLGPHLGSW